MDLLKEKDIDEGPIDLAIVDAIEKLRGRLIEVTIDDACRITLAVSSLSNLFINSSSICTSKAFSLMSEKRHP